MTAFKHWFVAIAAPAGMADAAAPLIGGSRTKVWADMGRTQEVTLPKTWDTVSAMPGTLYVEGVAPSASMRDIELKLEYDENVDGGNRDIFKCSDKVTLTAVKLIGIKFLKPTMSEWRTVDEFYKSIGAFTSQNAAFEVVAEPSAFPAEDSILWSGIGSGHGSAVEVTFSSKGMYLPIIASFYNQEVSAAVTIINRPTGDGHLEFAMKNPYETYIAKRSNLIGQDVSTLEPFVWAKKQYPGNQLNTIADAARHAYWACLLARVAGANYAAGLTTAHEVSGNGPASETIMDFLNNQVGIAKSDHIHTNNFECCRNAIINAVSLGETTYLDSSHGKTDVQEKALLQPTNK